MEPQPEAEQRVALVSGGTRGIGLGICRALVAEGFDLAIIGRTPEEQLDNLDGLRESGQEVLYCQGDISSTVDIAALSERVLAHFPQVNLLVNNAGVAPRERKDILETSEESFREVLNTNLAGPFFLTQRIAKHMAEMRGGDPDFQGMIINITSISATIASVERGEYCISKAGLAMLTKLYACRMAEYNIPVFEVRPGIIKTDMTSAVTGKYDTLFAKGFALTNRWGLPEDIGKLVAALTRGDFNYSTGQVFMADGGLTVKRL
jgi:NAD(P)-dependent dehydrogenase (short-subunit alcohol dehydrogenase family)